MKVRVKFIMDTSSTMQLKSCAYALPRHASDSLCRGQNLPFSCCIFLPTHPAWQESQTSASATSEVFPGCLSIAVVVVVFFFPNMWMGFQVRVSIYYYLIVLRALQLEGHYHSHLTPRGRETFMQCWPHTGAKGPCTSAGSSLAVPFSVV